MRRALLAGLLSALAAFAAGCGSRSDTSDPSGGASVAPSSTAALLRVNTDLGSPQWLELAPLLKLLPGTNADALPGLAALGRAVGPETDAVALTPADLAAQRLLGLTQSPNPASLNTLLAKHDPPLVFEDVAGWQVIAADRATIDRFKRARNKGTLASSSDYRDATAGLPSAALATVYVEGGALTAEVSRRAKAGIGPVPGVGRVSWFAGALGSAQGGLEVQLRSKGDEIEPVEYAAELPAQVPAPVSLFVDAKGLDATLDGVRRSPALTGRPATVVKALDGLLDDVIALFEDEAAFYVRPLPGGPEYTLVLRVDDEAAAGKILDRLATLASAFSQTVPRHLRVQGVPVTKVELGKTTVYYAVVAGKLVVTSAPSGIRGLVRDGRKIADTQGWETAAAAAGLPDQTAGIVYADLRRLPAALGKHLGLSASELAALPFGPGLAYAVVDGSVLSVKGFVAVR